MAGWTWWRRQNLAPNSAVLPTGCACFKPYSELVWWKGCLRTLACLNEFCVQSWITCKALCKFSWLMQAIKCLTESWRHQRLILVNLFVYIAVTFDLKKKTQNTYEHFLLKNSHRSSEVLIIKCYLGYKFECLRHFCFGGWRKEKSSPPTCQILSTLHFRSIPTDCGCVSLPLFLGRKVTLW